MSWNLRFPDTQEILLRDGLQFCSREKRSCAIMHAGEQSRSAMTILIYSQHRKMPLQEMRSH